MFALLLIFLGLSQLLLLRPEARGEDLLHFRSGSQTTTDALTKQNKVLVYVEQDCTPCLQYLKNLNDCSKEIKGKLRIVSLSTAAKTKILARSISSDYPLYLVKNPQFPRKIKATPTTRFNKDLVVGALDCAKISARFLEK